MTSENEEAAASQGGESGTTAEAGEVRAAGGAATPARGVRLVLRRGARGIPWLIIGGGAVAAALLVGVGFALGSWIDGDDGHDRDRPSFRAPGRFFDQQRGDRQIAPQRQAQPERQYRTPQFNTPRRNAPTQPRTPGQTAPQRQAPAQPGAPTQPQPTQPRAPAQPGGPRGF